MQSISKRTLILVALVASAAGLLAFVCLKRVTAGNEPPRLTEADYQAAVSRWNARGPDDYDLDLSLTGNRPGTIHVEVRGGEVTAMTRDGIQPKRRGTWDYWSVEAQLELIGDELDKTRDPEKGFGAPAGSQVIQWAEFDRELGYPVRYHRVVMGSALEIRWQITHFEARKGKADIAR